MLSPTSPAHELPQPTTHDQIQRTVLIALDHSKHSQYAFEWAKQNLLNSSTDLVVLVNVRPISVGHVGSFYEDIGQLVRDVEEENRHSSHRLLQHYGFDLKSAGYSVRAISIRGDSRADLIRKAEELHATILICGSRGLGTIQRALLGSVSNYIVHHCSCPVLVIRPPKDSELSVHGSKHATVHASDETALVAVDQESSTHTHDPNVPASKLNTDPSLLDNSAAPGSDPALPTAEGMHHAMSV